MVNAMQFAFPSSKWVPVLAVVVLGILLLAGVFGPELIAALHAAPPVHTGAVMPVHGVLAEGCYSGTTHCTPVRA